MASRPATPGGVRAAALLPVLAVALVASCGKKGPPLAPMPIVAVGINDLAARRLGPDVYLQFTIPVRNVTGEAPADIERVEVYALTGHPFELNGQPVDDETFLDYATLVGVAEVRPPPPPVETDADDPATVPPPPPPPEALDDDRPGQGAVLTFLDQLGPDAYVPVDLELDAPDEDDDEDVSPVWIPAMFPPTEPELTRYYVAVARNRRGQASSAASRAAVPLETPPPPPARVALHYGEEDVTITWTAPPLAPEPIQASVDPAALAAAAAEAEPGAPLEPPPLRSTPIAPQRTPYVYNLYDPNAIPNAEGRVAPINESPVGEFSFVDERLRFGLERCYVVLSVEAYGPLRVESLPAEPLCVTPVDTFRPERPRRLVAVGSPGAISLLWDVNDEDDLAGYVVLRGESPGETLQPITPEPIEDATYRDTSVTPGTRYVYAVLAVDSASPPNVSLESNRVEETAR